MMGRCKAQTVITTILLFISIIIDLGKGHHMEGSV